MGKGGLNPHGHKWRFCIRCNESLPLPPKHLYERKLTADLLEKQVGLIHQAISETLERKLKHAYPVATHKG